MKKRVKALISLFVCFALLLSCVGCGDDDELPEFDVTNEYGNNSSNVNFDSDQGCVAKQGDWMVTSARSEGDDNDILCLMSLRSGNTYTLQEDTMKKELRNGDYGFYNLSIVGDNVYYMTKRLWTMYTCRLYQYNIRTEEKIAISDDVKSYMATEDYVYYVKGDESIGYYLKKYDVAANEIITMARSFYGENPVFYNDSIYYVYNNNIYKMSLVDDNRTQEVLYEGMQQIDIVNISVCENKVYINDGNTIYCLDIDTGELTDALENEHANDNTASDILENRKILNVWAFDDKLVYYSLNKMYYTHYVVSFDLSTSRSTKRFRFENNPINVSVFEDMIIVNGDDGKNSNEIEIYSFVEGYGGRHKTYTIN